MNMFATHDSQEKSTSRYALYALAAACFILAAYAGLRATSLVSSARTQMLGQADRAIAAATAEHVRQDRVPNALIQAAEALLDDPALGLNYVTVRNAKQATLVSLGRFSTRFEFLGAGSARTLQGWDYRVESAEASARLPAPATSDIVGYSQFGVAWSSILSRAGIDLIIWSTVSLAGLIGFFGALVASAGRRGALSPNGQPAPSRVREPAATPEPAAEHERAPRGRLKRRRGKKSEGDEFAPIVPITSTAVHDSESATPSVATTPPQKSQQQSVSQLKTEATPAPSAQHRAAPRPRQRPSESAVSGTPQLEPLGQPAGPATAPAPARVVEEKTEPTPELAPSSLPEARTKAPDDSAPPIAPARAELHAPRIDAEPRLGDATLDLRFYPIWRDKDREVLAGACAALAWRTPETRLVDADTLTRLAEQKGALRAFTQWIARRFSLLHSNWRTLEINTVPIVLPIPSAMLAFADAEAVWRDALRRTDRDPNDLVLRLVNTRTRRGAHSSLPVRRALTLAGHDKSLPADCDVACIDAEQVGPDTEAWFARIEQLKCPVLLGPIADPEPFTRLINHNRVFWFSDDEQSLYSPRAFARLLTRCSTQPI